ncbi:MAG: MarR family winged helix-turn-helix transcriptional regulator [Acidimicrobiales bacterium]
MPEKPSESESTGESENQSNNPFDTSVSEYRLAEQVGHLLRRANQRHKAIFSAEMPHRIPPTQFAALAALREQGELSQNRLGRFTAMDSATIAGVVSRLASRGWVSTKPNESDTRMVVVSLTDEGRELIESLIEPALGISEQTLSAIADADRPAVVEFLKLLAGDDLAE